MLPGLSTDTDLYFKGKNTDLQPLLLWGFSAAQFEVVIDIIYHYKTQKTKNKKIKTLLPGASEYNLKQFFLTTLVRIPLSCQKIEPKRLTGLKRKGLDQRAHIGQNSV